MILVTGANGQLGQAIQAEAAALQLNLKVFDRRAWPIEDQDATDQIIRAHGGALVINGAAYTAVDRAETDREAALQTNAIAVENLYRTCCRYGATLIHISSDFVFGKGGAQACRPIPEEQQLSPVGVYAETKADGERRILNSSGGSASGIRNCMIVRTSWVFGRGGANFPSTILRLAADPERKEIKVVDDQIGRPTWSTRLARFLIAGEVRQLAMERGGIVHFSNNGIASWYDLAVATVDLASELGLIRAVPKIIPVNSSEFPRPAPRPAFSVLDLNKARQIHPTWAHWRDDLRNFLGDFGTASSTL